MEPECVRLHGELTLHASNPGTETTKRSFREAITIAEAHTAKSWELRAAMSLARLLRSQDRHKEAIACLEPVLDWFTEGLEKIGVDWNRLRRSYQPRESARPYRW